MALDISRRFIFASTRRVSLFLLLAFVAMSTQAINIMSMDVKVGQHRVGIIKAFNREIKRMIKTMNFKLLH